MKFDGKTVLVTGASRGVGRSIALAFAREGARVGLHYHQNVNLANELKESLPGIGHTTVQADLADPIAIERMVTDVITQMGTIDILVNNAGIYLEHPLNQTSYDRWQDVWKQTLDVNLTGAANVAYCVAHHMMQRRQGRIINITSRGAFRGEPTAIAYGASKAALNAFSQSLAIHLAPHNIGVVAVAPGWIDTDMSRAALNGPQGEAIRQQSPLNRVAQPEEIAEIVKFLAADESIFLTGGIIDVNGASYLRS